MGMYLVFFTVGLPCIIFLLWCLTPKGKHWLQLNNMI